VTAHHLDDCVETWVWSAMHGTPKIIPYRRNYVVRPFRLTRKRDFELWASMHQVPYVQDQSNENIHYTRNFIRHEMMSSVLKVNKGIHKVIAKKVKEDE
jgi:tRNA(Ile)-lysidine synthase